MPYNLTRSIIVEKYIFIYLFTSHLHTSFKKCHKMYRVIQVRIIRDDRKNPAILYSNIHSFITHPNHSLPKIYTFTLILPKTYKTHTTYSIKHSGLISNTR